jgi:membrane-bound lytic murein transglycosylase F
LKYFVLILVLFFSASSSGQKKFNDYDETFKKYSKRFFGPGYDWKLFKAQSIAESSLSPDAVSPVGARGLMQLMPSTFSDIQSANPDFNNIDDPVWNIAAGIYYDRQIFKTWKEIETEEEKFRFTFGSYNAGRGTIMKAQGKAIEKSLDHTTWENITVVAPEVPKWRHEETIGYVEKIKIYHEKLKKAK